MHTYIHTHDTIMHGKIHSISVISLHAKYLFLCRLYLHLSIFLFLYHAIFRISVSLCLFISISLCLSVFLFSHLSIRLSVHLSISLVVFEDTMPLFHDTLWKVTAIDIEFTLAKVMRRVTFACQERCVRAAYRVVLRNRWPLETQTRRYCATCR